ncbi:hypothetical protein N7492_007730 [Penicillium capsulatum]|uniref:C2H2-type domain-containing protein n=1 Tax=Penicillium capsulatum TaxID=69766 RepID=A0A9W9I0B4_9EURO|nr:hypothetical protein N7492_007730 [Penicillium capsulatum]KAJ6117562.1 hypothetical protein N7512_007287 [Penicillium capsulatum]
MLDTMQSTVYTMPTCDERFFDPSDIFTGLPSTHHDLLHYQPYAESLSTEASSHLQDQPPDLSSPQTARVYEDFEDHQISSPEQMVPSPSPGTMSPNPLILDPFTPTAEELLLDPSLSMLTTFQDLPHDALFPQKPQPTNPGDQDQGQGLPEIPICWDHGCNGKVFSSWSNLRRHQRERASQAPKCYCPRCGAHFSRTTARNQHLAKMSCKRIRRYSNGRTRPSTQRIQETYGTGCDVY